MPSALTYPGVYIEEIPSGVRTIIGVGTSITAFLGRTLRGPVTEPTTINGFADFERIYGGLWLNNPLGYAVRDFFLNGGSQAVIVRVAKNAKAAKLTAPDGLVLEAASPGLWGNRLRARIDYDVSEDVAKELGLAVDDLFNLTVQDMATGQRETFRNVTVKSAPPNAAVVTNVVNGQSRLVRISDDLPGARPKSSDDNLSEEQLKKPPFPPDGDDPRSVGVDDADKGSHGDALDRASFTGDGMQDKKEGLYALERVDLFNLLCIPSPFGDADSLKAFVGEAASYCEARRAMLLIDPPPGWSDKTTATGGMPDDVGTTSRNAAVFFPRLRQPNPLRGDLIEAFPPCGAIAGVFARTDTQRGVWKAPAGLDAMLVGVPALSVALTDGENGELNQLGVNCLRAMPAAGRVIWGSRTMQGADRRASEWKYIPVRRTALFLEESLYRGTQWVVFEPNDEPLWAQIRLNVGAFMHDLFRQGAFQGDTPTKAYFVKCDSQTTTQNDIDRGIVNILVGFAPLKPAEFVVIKIQQIAGQIET